MLLIARMMTTIVFLRRIARSNNNERWLIVMKEDKITPSNKQPNFNIAFQEQAMIVKQRHHHRDDHFFTSYVVLQEAMTTRIFLSVILQGVTTMVD
jgi:hypothetical protein